MIRNCFVKLSILKEWNNKCQVLKCTFNMNSCNNHFFISNWRRSSQFYRPLKKIKSILLSKLHFLEAFGKNITHSLRILIILMYFLIIIVLILHYFFVVAVIIHYFLVDTSNEDFSCKNCFKFKNFFICCCFV